MYDFYNSKIHKGNLPIRVLSNNFADWFFNISPNFKDEFDYEVNSNDLFEKITINIIKSKINEIAFIDAKTGITTHENFNQFLWSICYGTFVIFDEGIQRPSINKEFNGEIDLSNEIIARAKDLFNHSFSLFQSFNSAKFYELPNPEKFNEKEKFYIERTNGIYTASMVFILLHEFGHQYYGHLITYSDDKQSKEDEYLVDDFAYDKMSSHFEEAVGITYKFGIIMGIGGLFFLSDNLNGGKRHPDPDIRLKRQIDKMNLDDINNLWGVSSTLLQLWGIKNNKKLNDKLEFENYKEMFQHTLEKMQEYKDAP